MEAADWVPLVRRVAKEEEEEEAREEVSEKRRGTSASLAAGSTGGEGRGSRKSHGRRQASRDGKSKIDGQEGKGEKKLEKI